MSKQRMPTDALLITCGARAGDLRQRMSSGGLSFSVTKLRHDDPEGSYGDYLFLSDAQDRAPVSRCVLSLGILPWVKRVS